MKVDFFALDYQQEQPRSSSTFGINDGVQQDGKEGMAYTTTDGTASSWNAVVENKGKYEVSFTPLDHNVIIHPVPSETYSLCDGMLHRAQVWLAFSHKVQMNEFHSRTKFRLLIQNTIQVK